MGASSSNTPTALMSFSADKNEDSKSSQDIAHSSDLRHSSADETEIEDDDDDVPLALERWRSGVGKASNIAQLSMCLEELDAQVAWEKSVMKAVRNFSFCELVNKIVYFLIFSHAKFVAVGITNRNYFCATVVIWATTLIASR